jgi:uncharacterized protein (TIGR00369 family)
MSRQLPYHGWCFVCGHENPHSIGVTWFVNDDNLISSEFTLNEAHQGPPGFAHGGASAALLDEAMGLVIWSAGYKVAAVNLQINFLKPLPINQRLTLDAGIDKKDGRKIFSVGEIKLTDSTVAVNGRGIYVVAPQLFPSINSTKEEA